MKTDKRQIKADRKELVYANLTYRIIGLFYKIHTELGCGLPEKIYQRAIGIELAKEKIEYQEEAEFKVLYDNKKIGTFRIDLVIDSKIIVEIKAIESLPNIYKNQVISYLKASGLKLGFLVNFGTTKLQFLRLYRD